MVGYIAEPILLCMVALTSKMTYGTAGCPFTRRWAETDIDYPEEKCPCRVIAPRHMVTFTVNENYSEEDIMDVAGAMGKVAVGLRREG